MDYSDKEKADIYFSAYDRVLKVFEMNNDVYFKRTQILMVVIQSALFVAFIKLASALGWNPVDGKNLLFRCLSAIPLLGILSAYVWVLLVTRQHDNLELCRCEMREIESYLLELTLRVPLQHFTFHTES